MSILIFGFPQDIHLHAVRWALNQVGADHQVVYTPDLPQLLRASIFMAPGAHPTASFRDGSTRGATGGYHAVWFRRSGLAMRPAGMLDADWTVAERECDHHIRTLRRYLAPDALWVNDIEARERALLKSPQLAAAMACGLPIPETLFSNDPDDIRRFYAAHRERGVIFKLCLQTHWHAEESGARHALFTTQLRDEDLRDDEALSSCPAIYQRKIEKQYELRVTCMDGMCFAARLDSQARAITSIDWRADLSQPLTPQPCRTAAAGRGALHHADAQARARIRLHRPDRHARGRACVPRSQRDGPVPVGGAARAGPVRCCGPSRPC